MKLANGTNRPQTDRTKIVSQTDAIFLMIASVAAAVATTFMSVRESSDTSPGR